MGMEDEGQRRGLLPDIGDVDAARCGEIGIRGSAIVIHNAMLTHGAGSIVSLLNRAGE